MASMTKSAGQLKEQLSVNNFLSRTSALSIFPIAALAVGLVLLSDFNAAIRWSLIGVVILFVIWFVFIWHKEVGEALRNIENMLFSLREEDYSLGIPETATGNYFKTLNDSVNTIASRLRDERTGAVESAVLMQTVLTQIDIGVMIIDENHRIDLVNDRCCDILDMEREAIIGSDCAEFGLAECLTGDTKQLWSNGKGDSRVFQAQRSQYRERGKNRTLISLTDLSGALRRQELLAWQKMVKVLRHEVANSLAPIQSFGQTLSASLEEMDVDEMHRQVFAEGLDVIANRSAALVKLLQGYRSLTNLPDPEMKPVEINGLITDSVKLFPDRVVEFSGEDPVQCYLDREQMQQVIVNVLKNAHEAMPDLGAPVQVILQRHQSKITISIRDSGQGIKAEENLFVPFFTTKPDGEGIGLVLSRLIIERHGGEFDLRNRPGGGAEALITLPFNV